MKIIGFFHPHNHSKIIDALKNVQNKCVFFDDVIWIMAMKMNLEIKNR